MSAETQRVALSLQVARVWHPAFVDAPIFSPPESGGRLVSFSNTISLVGPPKSALFHITADTRYKLFINGVRVAVGPTRGCDKLWYFDTINVLPYLRDGTNRLEAVVWRVFPTVTASLPFERTAQPGLSIVGSVITEREVVEVQTGPRWEACLLEGILFPTDSKGDLFLNIWERVGESGGRVRGDPLAAYRLPFPLQAKTQGQLFPWRLEPRIIPMPEETPLQVSNVHHVDSSTHITDWYDYLSGKTAITLQRGRHYLQIEAASHSTAFLRFTFRPCRGIMKINYAEAYEFPPLDNPQLRNKGDRTDSTGYLEGLIHDYHDLVHLDTFPSQDGVAYYEPFWFRTFRFLVLEIVVLDSSLELMSFSAQQTNYPLQLHSTWKDGTANEAIWDVSVRTLRNCIFDGYSDCPFYEQLQYCQDSRSSALFHYSLSGDDRLMRQAIIGFAASVTPDGLVESRYPSHKHQVIPGFALFWILSLYDHLEYFNDIDFIWPLMAVAERILGWFDAHVDERGLVCNIRRDYWQYVDWTTEWQGTSERPDGGVPLAGRESNTHTYFSLLYAYTLNVTENLCRLLGRPTGTSDYLPRADRILRHVREHCWDGEFYTDSTLDQRDSKHHSQHVQIFAVLAGLAKGQEAKRILRGAFNLANGFIKASYTMKHYALRAFAAADIYEEQWDAVMAPYHRMLQEHLSTWEEDDVRKRSDCHAWGSVALYEFPAELAGVKPLKPGWNGVLWKPRVQMSKEFQASVCLGKRGIADVNWDGRMVLLTLPAPMDVVSIWQGQKTEHGTVESVQLGLGG